MYTTGNIRKEAVLEGTGRPGFKEVAKPHGLYSDERQPAWALAVLEGIVSRVFWRKKDRVDKGFVVTLKLPSDDVT
ncbi:MAG: hypothetical protein ACYCX4_16070 [Bacillota bacterium]